MSSSSATAPTLPAAAIPCPKPEPKPAKPTAIPAPIAANAVPNSDFYHIIYLLYQYIFFLSEGSEFLTSTNVKLSKVLNVMQT